jgi:hypothetical protein
MTLLKNASHWFQMFVAGFSLYVACSLALTAIYAATLEDGIGAPTTPPLMAVGCAGFLLAFVSLCSLIFIGCRNLWMSVARLGRATA